MQVWFEFGAFQVCTKVGMIKEAKVFKSGGLDLSRRGLDQDSQSWLWQKANFDGWENLDNFKKLVSTIEKSQSRSRNLDFVTTPLSSPKSLNRDREICQDLKILAKHDNLSWSLLRVSQWMSSYFSIEISQFVKIFEPEVPQKVSKMLGYLDKSWKVSKNLENLVTD